MLKNQIDELTGKLGDKDAEIETLKGQLGNQREAYERAQAQINLLGDANAKMKRALEDEQKISTLLAAEVDTLPDYIEMYHRERRSLIQKFEQITGQSFELDPRKGGLVQAAPSKIANVLAKPLTTTPLGTSPTISDKQSLEVKPHSIAISKEVEMKSSEPSSILSSVVLSASNAVSSPENSHPKEPALAQNQSSEQPLLSLQRDVKVQENDAPTQSIMRVLDGDKNQDSLTSNSYENPKEIVKEEEQDDDDENVPLSVVASSLAASRAPSEPDLTSDKLALKGLNPSKLMDTVKVLSPIYSPEDQRASSGLPLQSPDKGVVVPVCPGCQYYQEIVM